MFLFLIQTMTVILSCFYFSSICILSMQIVVIEVNQWKLNEHSKWALIASSLHVKCLANHTEASDFKEHVTRRQDGFN